MLTTQHDELLRERLEDLARHDRDYWSFKGNSFRDHGHALLQYPAMMVPQVARAILEQVCLVHPEIERVGDPFVGSGTVLTECQLRGLSFYGRDINPLAILLCRVKAGPFYLHELSEKTEQIKSRIDSDKSSVIDIDFVNRDKWFNSDVQISLSKIRRAILHEECLWARRFFWIAQAEAVHRTSNSRTSTFKLHIRPKDEIATRCNNAIDIFTKTAERNLKHIKNQGEYLNNKEYMNHGHYRMPVDITLGDIRQIEWPVLCDMILTSPPYGDNATTVPYGQYSYLPLQWIALTDVGPDTDAECLRTTHELDSRSLGGSKRIEKIIHEQLAERSAAFMQYIKQLTDQPYDRIKRVTAFFRDMDASLDPILRGLKPGGVMVWVLGNRKVGGARVPLDSILTELLAYRQVSLLCKLSRLIPSKRMAIKNNITDTISSETILVMRKAAK